MNQQQFFDLLFDGLSGEVQIVRKDKVTGKWFTLPDEMPQLLEYVKERSNEDLYTTTLTYSQRSRKKENAVAGNVLYTDADTCTPDKFKLYPSIVLKTSPGHFQAFWVLDQAAQAEDIVKASKRITYAHTEDGCDRNGWMPTKLLRIPNTIHSKDENNKHEVVAEHTGEVYGLGQVLETYADTAVSVNWGDAKEFPTNLPDIMEVTERLPEQLWNFYTTQPQPGSDLSERLWKFELELFRAGFTAEEVFVVVWHSPVNKYHPDRFGEPTSSGGTRPTRTDPEGDLWREVCNAEVEAPNVQTDVPMMDVLSEEELAGIRFTEPVLDPLSEEEKEYCKTRDHFAKQYTRTIAQFSDSSPEYNRTLAYILLGTVFGDKGFIVAKYGQYKLNMWGMILGESSLTFKTSAKNYFTSILDELKVIFGHDYVIGSGFSPEGLDAHLTEYDGKSGLFWRDEAHGFFKELFTKSYMQNAIEALTALYDGKRGKVLRARKDSSHNTEVSLAFNMMLMGIEKEMSEVLTEKEFRSGFLMRMVWAIADPPPMTKERFSAKKAKPNPNGKSFQPELQPFVDHLAARLALLGDEPKFIDISDEAIDRLNDFGWDAWCWALETKNPQNMKAAVQRMVITVWKCAALLAMVEGDDEIGMTHILPSIEQGVEWLKNANRMSNAISSSEFAHKLNELVVFLKAQGSSATRRQIYNKFNSERPFIINEWIEALTMQGRLIQEGNELTLIGGSNEV